MSSQKSGEKFLSLARVVPSDHEFDDKLFLRDKYWEP